MKTWHLPVLALLLLVAPASASGQETEESAEAESAVAASDVCCTIVSFNHRLGRGTALDHRSGEEFSFQLKKRSLANRIKEDEVLRMDRPHHKLMLYAPEECCVATSTPDLEGIAPAPEIEFVDCCLVVSYDANTGTGKARVRATGETFEFYVDHSIFTGMEAGDRLWIKPETMKVGVARDLECCSF